MRIIPRQEFGNPDWDNLCSISPAAWFFHTSWWLDYQVARGATDLSCVLYDDVPVQVVPILVTDHEALVEGHPGPGPFGMPGINKEAAKGALSKFIQTHGITRMAFRSHPFSPCAEPQLAGWETSSWETQVVSLTQPVEALHAGLRKSYTALINHVNGSHEITVDWQGDLIEPFRQLHAADAGRETRPRGTWEMQRQWCQDGYGLIVGASLGGVLVAATYWIIYGRCAYYASSASLHKNVTHALVWRAMLELKKAGVEQLELGWTTYDKSEKGKGIAQFKRGFGGEAKIIYAVERRF